MINKKKRINLALVSGLLFAGIVAIMGFYALQQENVSPQAPLVESEYTKTFDAFSYTGKQGTDALTLLKSKTDVKQDHTGLVTSINGRKVDSKKHEFWSFYVNGLPASIGPADYQTNDADKIEWKVEVY